MNYNREELAALYAGRPVECISDGDVYTVGHVLRFDYAQGEVYVVVQSARYVNPLVLRMNEVRPL